ncbi:MAG: hypothetical protein U9M97_01640, partial [Candidatus Hadarchaeota archaeon]|nr:hypothetical protein [Candidatus Hadarchaeota archaeon]
MDLRDLIKGLNVQEKKVLLALRELGGEASVARIQRQTELEQVAIMRAALSLKQHGLAQISEETQQVATLTEEGQAYADEGTPERRMLGALFEHGPGGVDLVAKRAGISKKQADISLGWLRRRGWIEFSKEKGMTVLKMTRSSKKAASRKTRDELLLEKLAREGSLTVDDLSADMRRTLATLKGRKLVEIKDKVWRTLFLTKKGEEALELGIEVVE